MARSPKAAGSQAPASNDPRPPQPERHPANRDELLGFYKQMLLIRRFEERAGEMYAKAKVGGFLHPAIGEEATIVGSCRALRDADYLISTYRSHGHALVRGTSPDAGMAELFGKQDGTSKGRGGSMHMFDLEKRFMGGYGIVAAFFLGLAAGLPLLNAASDRFLADGNLIGLHAMLAEYRKWVGLALGAAFLGKVGGANMARPPWGWFDSN